MTGGGLVRWALAWALIWGGGAVAEEIRGSSFGHGNWSGAGYTSNGNGAFSHCVVSAEYVSGDTLFLSVTAGPTVVIGVNNPTFRFREGDSFPVTVKVDRRAPFHARAHALDETTVSLEIEDFERGMIAIQRGNTMYIQSNQLQGSYSLKGTNRALDKAIQCAIDYLEYVGQPSVPQNRVVSSIGEGDLYQLTTKMIAETGATDFEYLSAEQVGNLGFENGVFWLSDRIDMLGGVFTLPYDGQGLRGTDGGDIAHMTSLCNGDFASKTGTLGVGGETQRQVIGICVEGSEQFRFDMVKTRVGRELLYTFLIFGPGAPDGPSEQDATVGNVAVHAAAYAQGN